MPDPVALFWDRMDLREPVFDADEWARLPAALRSSLAGAGVLQRTANARQVACDACDTGHIERVFDMPNPDGSRRFYIQCPEHGRIRVDEERLFRWAVNLDALVDLAVSVVGVSGKVEQLVPGRVWAAGRFIHRGVSRNVILARGVTWSDATNVVTGSGRIRIATPPVVLVIGRVPAEDLWGSKIPAVIPLDQALDPGPPPAVRMQAFDEALGAEMPQPARTRRPSARWSRRPSRPRGWIVCPRSSGRGW